MEDLIQQMKVVLATVYSFSLKAQSFHWNVTGIDFYQHHEFFGSVYENVYASADVIAEHIRSLGSFTPGSLSRFSELTAIQDEMNVPEARSMFQRLANDNNTLIAQIIEARNLAEQYGKFSLVSYLESRLEYHDKLRWMLMSHLS